MKPAIDFIRRHPLPTYFALVFIRTGEFSAAHPCWGPEYRQLPVFQAGLSIGAAGTTNAVAKTLWRLPLAVRPPSNSVAR